MSASHRGPIVYVLKRYPRLTETFILNEIRAMERLGEPLHIFSLLPPEPPPHHPMVAEVRAPVHAPPTRFAVQVRRVLGAHASVLAAAPLRYLSAMGLALRRTLTSRHPISLWRQFARAGVLAALCRRTGARHIHAHFANAPTSVAHFAHRMSGIPFSFTAHAKDIYLSRPAILRRHLHAAQFVTTCTAYNADYLRQIAPELEPRRVHLVYHGIDLENFAAAEAPAVRARGGRARILSVGRLVPKKGHEDLLAACARLRADGVDFECEIVGDGPLRAALTAEVERLGLSERVRFSGSMTHRDLLGRYRQADLFVLAPRIAEDGDRDGIPNVIAEAMAVGIPVVASDVSGIPELVRHGQTGWLAPSRDPAALAAAMRRILADAPLAERLARSARSVLEREFDLWQTTRGLHALMDCDACCAHDAAKPRAVQGSLPGAAAVAGEGAP